MSLPWPLSLEISEYKLSLWHLRRFLLEKDDKYFSSQADEMAMAMWSSSSRRLRVCMWGLSRREDPGVAGSALSFVGRLVTLDFLPWLESIPLC